MVEKTRPPAASTASPISSSWRLSTETIDSACSSHSSAGVVEARHQHRRREHFSFRGEVERLIVDEDSRLELPKRWRRVEPELVGQVAAVFW